MMTVRAIFAADDTWGIGKNGTLPWSKNSADLKWFRECTEGHIVMMGRRTWEDPNLPKPLPNRYNIVVSDRGLGKQDDRPNMVIQRDRVKSYLDNIDKDVWIIGGAQLLQSTLPFVEEIWVSRIQGVFDCDTFIEVSPFKFRLYESHEYFDQKLSIEKHRRYN
jgi:dihydrofolate reductase